MKKILIITSLTTLLLLTGCLKESAFEVVDTAPFPCGDTIYFSTEILGELLTPSCNVAGCHNSSAAAGYDFTSYGTVAVNASIILTTIQHGAGVTAMPLGGTKLNDTLITKFDCWIQQGKLNN